MTKEITKEVDRLYRSVSGQLVTSLVSFFKLSNLQLAEDIVQNTFVAALNTWSQKGIPDDPVAWLFKVCKNKTINELKKKKNHFSEYNQSFVNNHHIQLEQAFLASEIKDNQLRLLFAICHPAFSPKTRIILTLKTLNGFKVQEIAKGLGMKIAAVKKNLSRAKQLIKEKNLPLKVPFIMQSKERLVSVHQILYLIFNEGYSASSGGVIIRKELCLEAIKLTSTLLEEHKIANEETQALFALMLFNIARFEARTNLEGDLVELEKQDRSLWDQELINQGIKHFNVSRKASSWSTYHFEAAIASLHCTAKSFSDTNWHVILRLYDDLFKINPSPFVALNRNIALFYTGKAEEAYVAISEIKGLETHHFYHATLAKICSVLTKNEAALNHYLEALKYTKIDTEKRFIKEKIDALSRSN